MTDRVGLQKLRRMVRDDPEALGAVLTGSHALGLATPHSDYDVRVVLRDGVGDEARARYIAHELPHVDLAVLTLGELTDYAGWGTPFAWDRYSFAHAVILEDKTGVIAPLVAEKGRIPDDDRRPFTRGALDAFINSVYRSLKCARKRNAVCARLEAAEAIQHGLAVIFALEGRVRPYPAYLDYELRTYPPQAVPLSADDLNERIAAIVERGDLAALQQLFMAVLERAREAGYGEVIESWGDDVAWMQSYRTE